MEPMLPSTPDELRDLGCEVLKRSAALDSKLHPLTRDAVVSLLHRINSYYSNLIEGNRTHLRDIERALADDYDSDPEKKRLQLLHCAHIEAQSKIETLLAENVGISVVDEGFLTFIHREFYSRLPEEYCTIVTRDGRKRMSVIPGELRTEEVIVGRHKPPSAAFLPDFLLRFSQAYDPAKLHGDTRMVALAASHHRLAWIHPFLDGNGRVCRLFTHAYMIRIGLSGHGLWNVSRGLARHRDRYMSALADADAPRRNDYDGRGNLSQKGLAEFCKFFLETCLDQIRYMNSMLDLDGLQRRIFGYVRLRSLSELPGQEPLRPEAAHLLREALVSGSVGRGDVARVTGLGPKTARDLANMLVREGLLVSPTHRAPMRLGLPAHAVAYYFPTLVPPEE
jgi:Fic family protein